MTLDERAFEKLERKLSSAATEHATAAAKQLQQSMQQLLSRSTRGNCREIILFTLPDEDVTRPDVC
jgi:hypothetical protein